MFRNDKADPSGYSPFPNRRVLVLAGIVIVGIGAVGAYAISKSQSLTNTEPPAPTVSLPEIKTVTALGYLEPAGEVIKLSAPASTQSFQSRRVEQLLVQEGEQVKSGQVIAVLGDYKGLQATLKQAQAQVDVAKANLAQIKAGSKTGEIRARRAVFLRTKAELAGQIATQRATIANLEAQLQGEQQAQQATIERLEAEFKNAQTDYQRYQTLYEQGAVSAQDRDSQYLTLETVKKQIKEAQANLNRIVSGRQAQIREANANLNLTIATVEGQIEEAQATLNAVAEVRPVDVQIAENQVKAAQADVQRAKVDLETAYVRSPQNGQILKINTRPGRRVSDDDGIIEIANTSQMYAIAEVYQSDVSKVRAGQKVKVISDDLSELWQGTVEQVGLQVQRQEIINADPSENIDSRIVEVKVRLDKESSQKAARLTNLQVTVIIEIENGT